jgi:hypothetical protein
MLEVVLVVGVGWGRVETWMVEILCERAGNQCLLACAVNEYDVVTVDVMVAMSRMKLWVTRLRAWEKDGCKSVWMSPS